ncbi:MAG: hypothetical protein HZA94_00760 [Candidatus Vogelbacteria bacterium]|nr:hypothetical protein [Candidatus Vogelbacteria bacterium]
MDMVSSILILVIIITAVAIIGLIRGVWDWNDIKTTLKKTGGFFTKSTATPGGTLGKIAIVILLAVVYLVCIFIFFILGAFVSRSFTPWVGWPMFVLLTMLFIVNNSVVIPLKKFGRLVVWGFPTNICLPTGTYPIPIPGYFSGIQEFSTEEFPITFSINNVPLPDGTEAKITIKGSGIPDRDNITTFSDIGEVAGVQRNLATRAEPCVRDWFGNTDHGPQTWQEAKQTGSAVLPMVLKAILGDAQLPKIPSTIPTAALLRIFTTPIPRQTPGEEKQWGADWVRLRALLPRNLDHFRRLKDAVEARRQTIGSLTNGTASFVDQATGAVVKTLGFENIEILNGVAEEAVKAAKEAARGNAGLTAIKEAIEQAKTIVEAADGLSPTPLTPEQKMDLFHKELDRITADLKLVDKGAATMHIIPGLPELGQIIAQFMRKGTSTP